LSRYLSLHLVAGNHARINCLSEILIDYLCNARAVKQSVISIMMLFEFNKSYFHKCINFSINAYALLKCHYLSAMDIMMCDSHIFTHVKNVEHLIKCKTIAIYNLFRCSINVFFLRLIISLITKSTFFCFLLQNVMFCIILIVKIVEHRKVLL